MPHPSAGPAYRVETPRLVLRCWQPADAPLLKDAVDSSLEHLRPWMPWARHEPQPLAARVQFLRHARGQFDLGHDFIYGVFDLAESLALGGSGLHTRVGEGAREIGYWIRASHINQGLATELAGALTRVAFEVDGVDRVEIHCDPANTRSAAVARKLGYTLEATLRRRARTPEGAPRDTMIWTLFAADFPGSPAARAEARAFDVLGQTLL